MKNSVRHLVLGLAGIACVFALDSCAPRVAEKPKVEPKANVAHEGPRCTRDVTRILPGPTQCLQDLSFVDGEYVLETDVLDGKSDEFLLYKLNLKDLTISPYQNSILGKNQKLEYLMVSDKRALFLVSSNGHFSMLMKSNGTTVNIPLPFRSRESLYHSRIYFNQNRLFVYWDDRLLQWDIQNGKAEPRPDIKTSFGFGSVSCCFPWINKVEGEKLWMSNDAGMVLSFDLNTHKRTVVNKGSNEHNPNFSRDKNGRIWTWHVSKKNTGNRLETFLFELECSEKGRVVANYEITGIQSLFFDKEDTPMIWTKTGAILKLVGKKWIQLIESPAFAQNTRAWANAIVLEDGRICLLWKFDAEPRLAKVADPILKIIDIDKNEFEVMRFPFQLK